MAVIFNPQTGEITRAPDPVQIRVPFLRRTIGAGDVVKAATEAVGVQPCSPCEERRRRMNAAVNFTPWAT